MKVLYLIGCFGHGRGGHFYRLRATAHEMAKHVGVSVLSIGTSTSPVLSAADVLSQVNHIEQKVLEHTGVQLGREFRFLTSPQSC